MGEPIPKISENCDAHPDDQVHCPQPCAAFTVLEDIETIIADVKKKDTIGARRMRATTHYTKILKILEAEG